MSCVKHLMLSASHHICCQLSSCHFVRFGLAPNYGCCTANFNQGWPKFVQHLVYADSSGAGLVVAMYAPAYIQHQLPSGQLVTLEIVTDYPFSGNVLVQASTGDQELSLSLRVPSWAQGATVQVDSSTPLPATPGRTPALACLWFTSHTFCLCTGTLYKVKVSGQTSIMLKLPMSVRVERRYNNSAAIFYG